MNTSHQALIERLNYIRIQPRAVLLFGPFSAEEEQKIAKIYPKAKLSMETDLKSFREKAFDVILGVDLSGERSEFEAIFAGFKQSLKPGGMLLFTQFGCEHSPEFPDMHDTGDLLLRCDFENPVVDVDFHRIFAHAWAKGLQEKDENGAVKSIRVSLDRLLDKIKLKIR